MTTIVRKVSVVLRFLCIARSGIGYNIRPVPAPFWIFGVFTPHLPKLKDAQYVGACQVVGIFQKYIACNRTRLSPTHRPRPAVNRRDFKNRRWMGTGGFRQAKSPSYGLMSGWHNARRYPDCGRIVPGMPSIRGPVPRNSTRTPLVVLYIFRGEQEYDALVNNTAVTAIYQINVHLSNVDQPQLLWPSQTPANIETLLISSHASFDARFPTSTAWEPTAINYGNGMPVRDTCIRPNLPLTRWGADIGKTGGLHLRALPAGDSIAFGFQNTTGNGYRYNLQQVIQAPPIADFIGSQDSGTMPDPDNEGHSDAEIATIDGYLLPDLSQNPNIVFLFAGTNDINNNDDIDNAPARLMAVVDNITTTLPKTTVLVGTIPLNGDATKEQCPLWQAVEWGWVDPASGALSDGNWNEFCSTNPTSVSLVPAGGNREWRRSRFQRQSLKQILKIKLSEEAQSECTCQFTEPNVPAQVTGLPPSGKCSDSNDNSTAVWFAGAIHYFSAQAILSLQKDLNGDGRGINAGHVGWLPSGVISLGVRAPRHQVQFSDLNGDGRAEYLWIHDDSFVDTWLNSGGLDNVTNAAKVVLQPEGQIASGIGKDGAGVRFADLNGDGHAEYQWIDNNGAMTDYLNLAATDCGAHVGWLPQGIVATGPVNGATRNNIILADVNGDGRADYLKLERGTWLILSFQAAKVVWDPQGVIATGVGTSVTGVQFADLNGDGRAEYLDVNYITSAVNASLNGCA
ncbi:hypothetical protein B0H14DRAFT_2614355 [Mycena olivaceomarginata]|nr:hypothetical protein B0H14DRAFT_2614355 [Mycena olivaceomarginata]